jgi:hypothetical protein
VVGNQGQSRGGQRQHKSASDATQKGVLGNGFGGSTKKLKKKENTAEAVHAQSAIYKVAKLAF